MTSTDPVQPPETVVLVGNPRPRSRTRAAAETAARRTAAHLHLEGPTTTVDLAGLAPELLLPEHPGADQAMRTVAGARLVVVATPVYKASYTGLLKAFLDLYGPRPLVGVVAVPLVVSASAAHARAGDDHLRPLLVELGADVPATSLALLESDLPDARARVDTWLATSGLRPASAARVHHAIPGTHGRETEVAR